MSTAGAFFWPPSPNMLALLPMHPAGFTFPLGDQVLGAVAVPLHGTATVPGLIASKSS